MKNIINSKKLESMKTIKQFLEENNALESYVKETKKNRYSDDHISLVLKSICCRKTKFTIDDSFVFRRTSEGVTYWAEMSRKLKEKCGN